MFRHLIGWLAMLASLPFLGLFAAFSVFLATQLEVPVTEVDYRIWSVYAGVLAVGVLLAWSGLRLIRR